LSALSLLSMIAWRVTDGRDCARMAGASGILPASAQIQAFHSCESPISGEELTPSHNWFWNRMK
jgi:hypothetical protein